jgi:hypothetical protein
VIDDGFIGQLRPLQRTICLRYMPSFFGAQRLSYSQSMASCWSLICGCESSAGCPVTVKNLARS